MKIKVVAEKGQSLQQVEDALEKSLKKKSECSHSEQYDDPALNTFHDDICAGHSKIVDEILKEVNLEIERHLAGKGF